MLLLLQQARGLQSRQRAAYLLGMVGRQAGPVIEPALVGMGSEVHALSVQLLVKGQDQLVQLRLIQA